MPVKLPTSEQRSHRHFGLTTILLWLVSIEAIALRDSSGLLVRLFRHMSDMKCWWMRIPVQQYETLL